MKLLLGSTSTEAHADRLAAMFGRNARVAVIANALDLVPVEAQLAYARLGFEPKLAAQVREERLAGWKALERLVIDVR